MRPLLWLKFFAHFSFWAVVPGEFHMLYALTHQPKIVEVEVGKQSQACRGS